MKQVFVRIGLVVGALVVPVGGVGAAGDVTAQGKAVPVVSGASCDVPADGTGVITGAGRYDGVRTGAIQKIIVSVGIVSKDSHVWVDGVTTSSERTSGTFVFSVDDPVQELRYESGDSVRAYILVLGRRGKELAAYGYFDCR